MSKDSHKAFGRGTPAGNALYNLYNGKKNMDSTLDPDLLARLQKMRKEKEAEEKLMTKPKVVPKSQAYVNVPKPNCGRQKASAEQIAEWRLQAMGRRKRMDEIIADNQTMGRNDREVPQYDRPARTDADKAKFQQIMEHGEVLPPIQRLPKELANKIHKQKTRRQILSEEFDHLSGLIREKRAELREVQQRQGMAMQSRTIAEAGASVLTHNGPASTAPIGPTSVSNAAIAALRQEETALLIEIGRLVADMKQVDRDLCEIPEDED